MAHYLMEDQLEDVRACLITVEDWEFATVERLKERLKTVQLQLKLMEQKMDRGSGERRRKRNRRDRERYAAVAGQVDLWGEDA